MVVLFNSFLYTSAFRTFNFYLFDTKIIPKRKGSSSNSVLVKLIERLMDKGISAY